MPGPILHLGATVLCSHAGQAAPTAPFPRVLVSGQPVATVAAPYAIVGCGLTGSAPPCATAQWTVAAVRVLAGGVPVVIATGMSTTIAPGTPLMPVAFQPRVSAT